MKALCSFWMSGATCKMAQRHIPKHSHLQHHCRETFRPCKLHVLSVWPQMFWKNYLLYVSNGRYFLLANNSLWSLVDAVTNYQIPENEGNFLSCWGPVSFLGRTLLHGVNLLPYISVFHLHKVPSLRVSESYVWTGRFPSIYSWVIQVVYFPQVSSLKPCMHLSSPPHVLHDLPISVFLTLFTGPQHPVLGSP